NGLFISRSSMPTTPRTPAGLGNVSPPPTPLVADQAYAVEITVTTAVVTNGTPGTSRRDRPACCCRARSITHLRRTTRDSVGSAVARIEPAEAGSHGEPLTGSGR